MLKSAIVSVVTFCARRRWQVLTLGILLIAAAAAYDVARFSITSDTENLISQTLPWHQRQSAFSKAFPESGITVVITAATPENAEQATSALEQELSKHPDLFRAVVRPDGGDFLQNNGLLYQPLPDVMKSIGGLSAGHALISALAADPSLRGVMTGLSFAADGVQLGKVTLDQLVWPLSLADKTLSDALAGKPATFSWQELLQGMQPQAAQLQRFIEVQPVEDFTALQPGRRAADAIQRSAADLKLRDTFGARVELTGPVALNDDQFSVIQHSALRDTLTALIGALVILWLALRSWKIVAAVFFSLMVGLTVTAAFGLAVFGAFNLISIAFFVLFIGLGVDFGIQFSVRYRSERHEYSDLGDALRSAAGKVSAPLALAAAATAVAFFAFLPTDYRGLFELGLVAGCGMLVAFVCSITFVPAMLAVLKPPGEPVAVGFKSLAPLDDFLQRHRIAVIAGTVLLVLAGSPLLFHLRFDFNPINLQNPNAASVLTYRELQQNPRTSANEAEILAPSLAEADAIAKRLAALPEVSSALTLDNFIPDDQDRKVASVKAATASLGAALNPQPQAAPSDNDMVEAIRKTARELARAAGSASGPGATSARHVSDLLTRLAQSDATTRSKVEAATVPPLIHDLERLRISLDAHPVTLKSLPASLVRNWVLPDSRARVQVLPKGDLNDDNVLRKFSAAVLAAEPAATGPAISLIEAGKTVIGAFVEAGVLALAAIAVLLFIALRRLSDVLLTLIPLLLAAVVTLEICVLTDTAINFANIIAVPLLLGVGVAFKIYYIMAWRAGKTGLLQSSLTRAVVFSAMTTAVAFGSMWSSSYPGMSSMGKLMAIALLCTMTAAVLFQPVLMGRPRQVRSDTQPARELIPDAAE
jgi:uncharacterized protein